MPSATKPSKNQLRRAKKKAAKQTEVGLSPAHIDVPSNIEYQAAASPTPESSVEPETQPTTTKASTPPLDDRDGVDEYDELDPLWEMYKDVIGKFEQDDKEDPSTKEPEKPEIYYEDDDDIPDE